MATEAETADDPVADMVAFADLCRAGGDTWLERPALQEALRLARERGRPIAALCERIDALNEEEGESGGN